jgi:hypothetical protein
MSNANTNRTTGIALVGLGLLFVFLQITGFSLMSLLWPLWVLIPGALMLFAGFNGEKAHLGWNVPGAVVGGTGAILFLLNLTGRWETWAYMWALYPVFVGAALYYTARHNSDDKLMEGGKRTMQSGLGLLVGFGLFFELLIYGGLSFLNSALLPIALIGIGAYMIFFQDKIKFNMPTLSSDKPKRNLADRDPETGIDVRLRREIDQALAEEEQVHV